jgi:hypothetical protein
MLSAQTRHRRTCPKMLGMELLQLVDGEQSVPRMARGMFPLVSAM